MQLVTVESSMIHAVGYDPEKRILEIVFNTGRTYQYADVPPEVYEGLLNADSKGRYFLAHIRDVYDYWQVGGKRRGKRMGSGWEADGKRMSGYSRLFWEHDNAIRP